MASIVSSSTRAELSYQVVSMFRKMCREASAVASLYDLPYTPSEVRHLVGLQFRRNGEVKDPRLVEMLLAKAEMELEESRNQWKQRPHLITLLNPTMLEDGAVDFDGKEAVERDDFVTRFLDNDLGERPSVHARD